ncbi:MAG: hypothetical protein IME99_04845 [Proteobacteria bacterium]|nr:hypothetical protein [Pseudomonadota bacterium]
MRLCRVGLFCLPFSALLLSFILLTVSACTKQGTPEEEIRKSIDLVAGSVREKDVKAFMDAVSRDYRDPSGLERRGVKGMIFRQFMAPGELKLFVRDVAIEVVEQNGTRAVVEARIFLVRAGTGESIAETLPTDAEGFRFRVVMGLEEGRWRARSAEWEAVGLLGLI